MKVDRREYKFYISYRDALRLKGDLALIMQQDMHSTNGSYLVRSLYFDTINNMDFYEKMAGYENRKKIRLRIYNLETETVKLELKVKQGVLQCKYSILLAKEDAIRIMYGDFGVLLNYEGEAKDALLLYNSLVFGTYRPVVLIEYDRYAYMHPEFNTRITFDSMVRSSEIDLNLFEKNIAFIPIMDEYVLLEVKFNQRLIGTISDILRKYRLTQVSNSKYCNGRLIFNKYLA